MSDVGEVSVKITADASGVDRAISNVKGQFSQLSNDLTGIAKGFNLDNVASQIDKVSDKFKGLGSTLAISAAPFEIYGALAVKAFSDFEKGIGKINTLLPDATKAEMAAVGEQLKAFSSEFGADINDAIQAYYDALSAGVAQGDVLPFMETAQKAGVAGMSDVSVAVDGLTSILNSYQKKTSEAENVSDVMFKTVELGKIEFEQLAANIGKVAPTAAQFKIGFEDVGAAIASITSQGLKPEQTMTVLTSLISQLGKSGTDLSNKFKEITGQSFPDFIASGGTLADAIGKIRDYSQDTGTSLMDMTGNLEAAKGLAMLGGSAFEQYAGFLDKISDSAGATDTAYSKMTETMAFAMDQLKAQMQTTMIEVGDALAPVVKDFTKWLSENSDEISDFAVSIAQNAVPAIEGLFDIMKKLMDFFNNLPAGTKSLLAQLLGVGIAGAAIGGPALFAAGSMGTAISSVMKLASYMGKLVIPATVAGDITAIGTAASGAAGASGVGALSAALAAIGGPVTLGAIAGVGLAIVAWETDFMGVRTTALDSAEAIFAGFQNTVSSALEFIGGAAPAISEAFWGALSDPDYESQLIPNLQAVFAEATDTAELEGRAAAAAWIDNWNSEIASGIIKAPEIPDSQTALRTNTGINEPYLYPEGMVYVNGSFQSTVYTEGAAQYAAEQKKFNSLFAQFPTQQAQASQQGTQTGTKAGIENAAPVIAEQTGKSVAEALAKEKGWYDRGQLDIAAAERLLEKAPQLADKYKQNTPAGTASDPLVVTTPATSTGSTPAATSTSSGTFERPSGNIPDLFTRDPAKYVEQELKSILNGGFDGSIAAYESYLKEFGMTLEDKAKQFFTDAKSKGFGGNIDYSDWLPKAMKAFDKTGTEAKTSSSVISALGDEIRKYNQTAGQQTKQSTEMENATRLVSAAQNLYTQYMDDGKLTATEASKVQELLSESEKALGDAGIKTAGDISKLPPALQEIATSIVNFISTLKSSAVESLNTSLSSDGWKTAINSSYPTMIDPKTGKPVQRSYLDIDVILGLKDGSAKVDSLTEANKALQNSMYANVGTAGLLSSAYQAAGNAAIETMNKVVNAAADKIAQANAVINNLSYSNSGNSISASNYMPGMTYSGNRQMFIGYNNGYRNSSPCASDWLLQQEQRWYNNQFASGGPVSETGPALVHEGEYILSRSEVERMGKGGANIQLNVNMNNSRFGNAEIAKDLPKLFAKATKRAFIARGSI